MPGLHEGDVKLVGGSKPTEGNVYIRRPDGRYGPIRDDISLDEGNVICKQLGYASAASVTYNSHFGSTGAVVARSFNCDGDEDNLLDCSYSTYDWIYYDNDGAGVVCNEVQIDYYGGVIHMKEYNQLEAYVRLSVYVC